MRKMLDKGDPSMRNKDLVSKLTDFGLTEEEASTYYILIKNGPTTATVVAKHLGTNRMRAYRVLDSLVEKQFARSSLERPKKYIATDIDEALSLFLNNYSQTLSQLKEKEKELVEEFRKLVKTPIGFKESAFRIIQGRRQVYRQITTILDRGTEEIYLYIPNNDLYRFEFADIDTNLRDVHKRGVDIKILTHIDENVLDKAKEYAAEYDLRHIQSFNKLRFILHGKSEIFFSFPKDDSMSMTTRDDTGLWTNNEDFVIAMRSFFEENWSLSLDATVVIEALRRGEMPQFIRLTSNKEEHDRIYDEMIAEARSSLDILTKKTENILAYSHTLVNAQKRGVKIRILTELSYDSLEKLLKIFSPDQIKGTESKFDILITDKKRVIMFIPIYKERGNSITSNNKIYVETISEIYEDYWSHGLMIEELGQRLIVESRFREAMSILMKTLSEEYTVEQNKEIMTNTGIHEIKALVTRIGGKPVIIEFTLLGEESRKIAELYAKTSELKMRAILASFDEFPGSVQSLATLFNISLVNGDSPEKLAARIAEELQVS